MDANVNVTGVKFETDVKLYDATGPRDTKPIPQAAQEELKRLVLGLNETFASLVTQREAYREFIKVVLTQLGIDMENEMWDITDDGTAFVRNRKVEKNANPNV